jgi:plastocyanin
MMGLGGVRAALVVGFVLGCGLVGCKSGAGGSSGETVAKPAAALDPATLGDVSGVVKFAGKAPEPVKIDTSMDPACGFGGGGDVYSEQYAVKDGKLANVYVYVKSWHLQSGTGMVWGSGSNGPGAVLDQKGCVYTPHVIAVEAGDFVEFRNEDPTMHNVHTMPMVAGNATVDISQGPKGAPQRKQFREAEVMIPVRCNNHPWMNAFINVSATPWFAVTGANGKFTLKGLPAGEYTIGAVQEKMSEQTMTVTVAPHAEAKADFTFAIK